MNQETEFELKAELSQEDYEKLLTHFARHENSAKLHENHYFDDKKFTLCGLGTTFRVRNKKGTLQIEMKIPQETGGMKEIPHPITPEEFESLKAGTFVLPSEFSEELEKIGAGKLSYVGMLPTRRISIEVAEVGGKFELDHSTLANGSDDFELEMEYEEGLEKEAEKIFENTLDECGIKWIPSEGSKYSRFVKSLPK